MKTRPAPRVTSTMAAAIRRSRDFFGSRRLGDGSMRRTARVRRAAQLTRELFTFMGMG
jgi:hypothetical protein